MQTLQRVLGDDILGHHAPDGYPHGLKETPYRILMQEKPEVAMRVAVRGMMPKNTVAKDSLKRLHIYAGAEHKQQAQKPIALDAE